MKPCPSHRESVALLACGEHPDGEADELRRHLQACAGCRDYFRQLSAVCDEHTVAARSLPGAEVSPRLRGRIAALLRADADRQRGAPTFAGFTGWGLIAGMAAILMVLVGGAMLSRKLAPPVPVAGTEVPPSAQKSDPSTSSINLFAYRLALGRSQEDLDELLSHEAARRAFDPEVAFRVSLARLDPGL